EAVDALTTTLAGIITEVQEGLTGSTSVQDGTNTRVRGELRTVTDAAPPPFGPDADTWHRWIKMTTGHTRSIAAAAVQLAHADEASADVETLATIAPAGREDGPMSNISHAQIIMAAHDRVAKLETTEDGLVMVPGIEKAVPRQVAVSKSIRELVAELSEGSAS